MKQKFIFAAMALALTFAAPVARAEEAATEKLPAVIDNDTAFEKDTETKGFTPYGQADLEYQIQIPKDWEADEDLGAKAKSEGKSDDMPGTDDETKTDEGAKP